MEQKTLEQYEAEIREWDWDGIKADALVNADDPDITETGESGETISRVFLGTVFALAPSGKYYMPWTSNQTEEDVDEDSKFYEALDNVAEEHGMFIESGEGDPCDLFAGIVVENKMKEKN